MFGSTIPVNQVVTDYNHDSEVEKLRRELAEARAEILRLTGLLHKDAYQFQKNPGIL